MAQSIVSFRDVSVQINATPILSGLSFDINADETLVLLGRSGSGKTTALKLTNSLILPTSGQVLVEGKPTTEWDSVVLKRRTGYVIQEGGLFPHFTVAQNVGLVPALEGWVEERTHRRVDELLDKVGLEPQSFRSRYPKELSGGQRQRVGVARALAADPPLLLFDEPFGALDPVIRAGLQREYLGWSSGKTSIFVTHDVREALKLGTRIALLSRGRLDFVGTPDEFLHSNHPEVSAFREALS